MINNFNFDRDIDAYLEGEIDINSFLEMFPKNTFGFTDKLVDLLSKTLTDKDSDKVEYLTIAADADGVSRKYSKVLCKLLRENWHEKHEDIVMLLEKIKDPNTVDCIFSVVYQHVPSDDDDYYALGLKCIWALGAINDSKAIERLEELAKSDVEFIRNTAIKQLQHIRKEKH